MTSRSIADCHPILAQVFLDAKNQYEREHPGYTVIITCTERSTEEQQKLFRRGRVLVDGEWRIDSDPNTSIVTNIDGVTKKSNHNHHPARAIDFAIVAHGKVIWHPAEYAVFAGYALRDPNISWGGHWKSFKDYPHLELK
jgi:peptidoglycan L-alanyl-D-glutamate endopeptidase CwlK